jgi:hypothetical protein
MNRFNLIIIFFLSFFVSPGLSGICPGNSESIMYDVLKKQDTLAENHLLFNGRVWRNLYLRVKENQFLFSREHLPGSVTMNGEEFKNVRIRYDIYNDEILTPFQSGGILQLNKEMVDSFSILFQSKTYHFTRIPEDSLNGLKGYVNVIYKGKSALYVKYLKKIDHLPAEGEYDQFYQVSRIYFVKDNTVHLITGKRDLMKVLYEDKVLIKNYIKENKLYISQKNPESFVPVIRYFDTIKQ